MALTKITANVIEAGAISTASLADTSITADKLAATLDLTGKAITVATASAGDNDTTVASTAFVTTAIANLTDSAPAALDTLNELAAALNDDANFSTTVTNSIALKAPLASPDFTGDVTFDTSTLVVDSTNNRVGIGTTSPDSKLHIVGSTNALRTITMGDTSGNNVEIQAAISLGNPRLAFLTAGSEAMRIDESGNVGIGTSNPSNPLEIEFADATAYSATANNPSLEIGNINSSANTNFSSISMFTDGNGRGIVNLNALNNATAASADFSIQTRHNGTLGERLRVTSSGNVGIGQINPDNHINAGNYFKPD